MTSAAVPVSPRSMAGQSGIAIVVELWNNPRMSRLQVLLAALCFGTTGTAQALGPAGIDPAAVGAARIACGGALLVLFARLVRRERPRRPPVVGARTGPGRRRRRGRLPGVVLRSGRSHRRRRRHDRGARLRPRADRGARVGAARSAPAGPLGGRDRARERRRGAARDGGRRRGRDLPAGRRARGSRRRLLRGVHARVQAAARRRPRPRGRDGRAVRPRRARARARAGAERPGLDRDRRRARARALPRRRADRDRLRAVRARPARAGCLRGGDDHARRARHGGGAGRAACSAST